VVHGSTRQGAERRGRSRRLCADLLRHAQSDVVLESRQVTDASAFPIKKMPVRVAALGAPRTT
jgi:hypothetical protein